MTVAWIWDRKGLNCDSIIPLKSIGMFEANEEHRIIYSKIQVPHRQLILRITLGDSNPDIAPGYNSTLEYKLWCWLPGSDFAIVMTKKLRELPQNKGLK